MSFFKKRPYGGATRKCKAEVLNWHRMPNMAAIGPTTGLDESELNLTRMHSPALRIKSPLEGPALELQFISNLRALIYLQLEFQP